MRLSTVKPLEGGAPPPRTRRKAFRRDDRAVSVVTGYIMTLTISTILLATVFVSNRALLAGAAGTSIRDSLDTMGADLALRITNIDRVINTTSSVAGNLSYFFLTLTIPTALAGEPYSIEMTDEFLRLEPRSFTEFAVRIPLNITHPLVNRTLSSSPGRIQVVYNQSNNSLELQQ